MKGKLKKTPQGWVVNYFDIAEAQDVMYFGISYPLHQDDVEQIRKDSLIFDNIEARIAAYPDVDFTIERYCLTHKTDPQTGPCTLDCAWDTKKYAKLIPIEPHVSDDFQIGPDGAHEHKESKKVSWDELFNDVESKLDIYIPIRAINYIKNNYKKPKRKK